MSAVRVILGKYIDSSREVEQCLEELRQAEREFLAQREEVAALHRSVHCPACAFNRGLAAFLRAWARWVDPRSL